MVESKSEKARRYQPRLSLDSRMGEVFEELMALPEEVRKTELTFLVQLGFLTKKALGQTAAASITAALGAPSQLSVAGQAQDREAGPPVVHPTKRSAEEMAGAAVASLQGWSVDDDAFQELASGTT